VSGESPDAITASSSQGRGEGKSGSEKQGVGGISIGSQTGLIVVGKVGGEMNSMKPSMTASRPRGLMAATPGADAAQRAMEDAISVLKAVGKGSSETEPRSTLTSPSSMPCAEMRGGMGSGVGEGGISGLVNR